VVPWYLTLLVALESAHGSAGALPCLGRGLPEPSTRWVGHVTAGSARADLVGVAPEPLGEYCGLARRLDVIV
jgi:hypothetical protein